MMTRNRNALESILLGICPKCGEKRIKLATVDGQQIECQTCDSKYWVGQFYAIECQASPGQRSQRNDSVPTIIATNTPDEHKLAVGSSE